MKNTQSRFKLAKIAGVMTAVAISGGAFAQSVQFVDSFDSTGAAVINKSGAQGYTDANNVVSSGTPGVKLEVQTTAGSQYQYTYDAGGGPNTYAFSTFLQAFASSAVNIGGPIAYFTTGSGNSTVYNSFTIDTNYQGGSTVTIYFNNNGATWAPTKAYTASISVDASGKVSISNIAVSPDAPAANVAFLNQSLSTVTDQITKDSLGFISIFATPISLASITTYTILAQAKPVVVKNGGYLYQDVVTGNLLNTDGSAATGYVVGKNGIAYTQAQHDAWTATHHLDASGNWVANSVTLAAKTVTYHGITITIPSETAADQATAQALQDQDLITLQAAVDNAHKGYVWDATANAFRSIAGQQAKAISLANPNVLVPYTTPDGKTHAFFNGTYYASIDAVPAPNGFHFVKDAGDSNYSLVANSVTLAAKNVSYRGRTITIPSMTAANQAAAQAMQDQFQLAQQAGIDNHITNLTNEAVGGAIVTNIIADEFVNPALKEYGVSVAATVSGTGDFPEEQIGVNKDLSKETGIDGLSANIGAGIVSGNISAGLNKSFEINENIRVNVGVSVSENGVSYLPGAMVHQKTEFAGDVGVGFAGPLPVVMVGGYQVTVVPQLFIPNLCVIAAKMIYNFVKSEIKAAQSTPVNAITISDVELSSDDVIAE